MWKTIGRILRVGLFWAVVSAGAAAVGFAAGRAQLFSGLGAGLSLILWGILVHRATPSPEATTAASPAELPGRRSATV